MSLLNHNNLIATNAIRARAPARAPNHTCGKFSTAGKGAISEERI